MQQTSNNNKYFALTLKFPHLKWDVSPEERELILNICIRAWEHRDVRKMYGSIDDLQLDITCTHCNGTSLDLHKLLHAKDFDFGHDIGGIHRALDRHTGKMTKGFLPRCYKPQLKDVN